MLKKVRQIIVLNFPHGNISTLKIARAKGAPPEIPQCYVIHRWTRTI